MDPPKEGTKQNDYVEKSKRELHDLSGIIQQNQKSRAQLDHRLFGLAPEVEAEAERSALESRLREAKTRESVEREQNELDRQ